MGTRKPKLETRIFVFPYHASMLKYRLPIGLLMMALLVGLIHADERIGRVDISGTALSSLLAGQSYLPAGIVMLTVFFVLAGLGASELCDLFRARGMTVYRGSLVAASVVGLSVMYLAPREAAGRTAILWVALPLIAVLLFTMLRHAWRRQAPGALAAGAAALFAMVYLGVVPGFLLLIRDTHSAAIVAAVILTTKVCDIGAYTAGRLFGRRQLIPWLSPGKTWEGLAGGVALSALVAAGLAALHNHCQWPLAWSQAAAAYLHRPYPIGYAALFGVIMAVVGHAGDLMESLLKRDAGLKDSGTTIPGFGGVLDVIDSPLITAPAAFLLLEFAPQ
jgi:phosphatidate cytidylyltransferase